MRKVNLRLCGIMRISTFTLPELPKQALIHLQTSYIHGFHYIAEESVDFCYIAIRRNLTEN
jgi:hypothetical protein